ncbi:MULTISPECIES: energy transducer TonB [Acinetobacter]|uniref:energy transducer TonB n=1 Tax=Acinetobacter TaxID=469 RepID=UPI00103069C2|nr:energy transducer TonB [Acinetobacter ihumii]
MGNNVTELESNSAKRLIGIGAVIFLHLVIFYALLNGLNQTVEKPVEKPVELQIIQDKPPEPEKPKPIEIPPEPPKVVKEVMKTPEPEKPVEKVEKVQKTAPVAPSQPTKATTPPTPTMAASPSPVAAPMATPAPAPAPKPVGATRGVSNGEAGCKQPDYPRDALQNEEQGSVTISVLVDTNGKVKEAKVKKSSGSKSLDRAASKAFSLCTFKPALKDGEAQESWYDIPYEFVLD